MAISKDMLKQKKQEFLQKMNEHMEAGKMDEAAGAFLEYQEALSTEMLKEFEEYKQTNDEKILAQRGVRQLLPNEKKYYEKLIDAMKSTNPKQAITNIDIAFPETIINGVFDNLVNDHPLLGFINFQNTTILTKWILNDHTADTAVWGDLTSDITKEITSAFRKIEIGMFKLSAFLVIDKSMLDLGPTWLDAYVRAVLGDSIACGLEKSIVTGNGKSGPIGMDRDISENVTITGGVYPRKAKIKVTSFAPKEYGELLAKMVQTEKKKNRKFSKVLIVCTQKDYLTKVMPATTLLTPTGTYATNIFPFPTDVTVSNELADGEAIVAIPNEYFFGLGTGKDGKIDYSDDIKFFEDQRAYIAKLYGNGKMTDNTCSLLLDISALEPTFVTINTKSGVTAA